MEGGGNIKFQCFFGGRKYLVELFGRKVYVRPETGSCFFFGSDVSFFDWKRWQITIIKILPKYYVFYGFRNVLENSQNGNTKKSIRKNLGKKLETPVF